MASIKAEVEDFKEKQLADINTQIGSAQQELKAGLDGFAKDMASKILGRAL
jgi:F0F1-type ATP synthase membrane subunit b/b'